MRLNSALFRAAVLALVWWMLADGDTDSWVVGLPLVIVATLTSLAMLAPVTLSLTGILRLAPFFIWHSLRGGVDVAWRALHPKVPVYPALVEFNTRLPPGLPRILMVNTVSLLPGTLSADLRANCLQVHVLASAEAVPSQLLAQEQAVARVFGIHLPEPRE